MNNFLKHYISVALYFARLDIQRQLEYPIFLLGWILSIPIYYFSSIWMLRTMVDRFHPLAGWDFPQLTFVFGLGLISQGLQVFLFVQSWQIESMLNTGSFDRLITRPMNVFFQFSVQHINFVGVIDLMAAVIVFSYACKLIEFNWTIKNSLSLIVIIIGGTLIRSALYTISSSLAFWLVRSRPLNNACRFLLEYGTLYPLSIYPYLLQWVLTWIIPIGFISFYPASELLDQKNGAYFSDMSVWWTPIFGLSSFLFAYIVFSFGLRRYESTGS